MVLTRSAESNVGSRQNLTFDMASPSGGSQSASVTRVHQGSRRAFAFPALANAMSLDERVRAKPNRVRKRQTRDSRDVATRVRKGRNQASEIDLAAPRRAVAFT